MPAGRPRKSQGQGWRERDCLLSQLFSHTAETHRRKQTHNPEHKVENTSLLPPKINGIKRLKKKKYDGHVTLINWKRRWR